ATLHQRSLVFVLARDVAARVHHVGEHHRRPAEHVVFEDAARVDRDVVLDLDVVADGHVGRDHHVLPDIAARADARVLHHVREVPDFAARADLARRVHVAGFMYEVVFFFHCRCHLPYRYRYRIAGSSVDDHPEGHVTRDARGNDHVDLPEADEAWR